MKRRGFVLAALAVAAPCARARIVYPRVEPGTPLVFPRDHGSHPAFRTEWWYLTGWLRASGGEEFGVQVTFFRSRPGVAEDLASSFAPTQLLFAHAALADPRRRRLRHEQRAARGGFDLAHASETTTAVRLGDWTLALDGEVYRARLVGREFALRLDFRATQPLLLQGDAGVSRKGPAAAQASFYYSRPQLAVAGSIEHDGRAVDVDGRAWLDHEWSSEYLAAEAQGWDWIGLNLDDGGALMAFRIRDRQGGVHWAGGTLRDATGRTRVLDPAQVRFEALRYWRSPRTGIAYPVAFAVHAGGVEVVLEPLFDDQELDARGSVGTVYWEGAVRALRQRRPIGRGYLELTGYGDRVRF